MALRADAVPVVATLARPGVVRFLALAAPALAAALGAATETSAGARAAVRGLALLPPAVALALVAGARAKQPSGCDGAPVRPPSRGATREHPPAAVSRLTVVIPARDEANCVGGVLADLGRQESPASLAAAGRVMDVVVVDDRSTDGTGEAARRAIVAAGLGARAAVVRRSDGVDGKGAALAVLDVDPDPRRLVVVLDADTRIGPEFVAACARSISAATPAVAARRRMLRPTGPGAAGRILAVLQDDEQAIDHLIQRARASWGGASELRGNGMILRADLLDAVGGWPRDALCEDLELSTAIHGRAGVSVARPPGLVVWEQPVTALPALLVQRTRWAEGFVRRDLRATLPMLLGRRLPARAWLDVAAYALQGIAPWVALGVIAGAVIPGRHRSRRAAIELAAGYASGAIVLASAAIVAGGPDDGQESLALDRRAAVAVAGGACRVAGALLLLATWGALLPVAWLRVARRPAEVTFVRTPHLPTDAFSRLPS